MGFDFASDAARSKEAFNIGTGISLYFCFLYALTLSETFGKKSGSKSDSVL